MIARCKEGNWNFREEGGGGVGGWGGGEEGSETKIFKENYRSVVLELISRKST